MIEHKTRFSKLQKWILVTCYKKTILLDNSGLVELRNKIKVYWQYLFRTEIITSFFGYKNISQRYHCVDMLTGNVNKYQVSITRSFKSLALSGYIKKFEGVYSHWSGIQLTEKGIEKAKDILNANSRENFPNC